jgi:hypothetical protein
VTRRCPRCWWESIIGEFADQPQLKQDDKDRGAVIGHDEVATSPRSTYCASGFGWPTTRSNPKRSDIQKFLSHLSGFLLPTTKTGPRNWSAFRWCANQEIASAETFLPHAHAVGRSCKMMHTIRKSLPRIAHLPYQYPGKTRILSGLRLIIHQADISILWCDRPIEEPRVRPYCWGG